MKKALSPSAVLEPKKPVAFNYNKLHATLCILASSAVSISLIVWLVKTLF
ncbi:hypothetical protein [Noviherbaspirillum massiliense]|nr:hypothetical protein [Noviherbaspirillum massiliense]